MPKLTRSPASLNGSKIAKLQQSFQPLIARFHPVLHAGGKHCRARFGVGQSHAHGYERAGAVGIKIGFNVVVRCGIRQVHALDVHDPAIRLEFQILSREVESLTLSVAPL